MYCVDEHALEGPSTRGEGKKLHEYQLERQQGPLHLYMGLDMLPVVFNI